MGQKNFIFHRTPQKVRFHFISISCQPFISSLSLFEPLLHELNIFRKIRDANGYLVPSNILGKRKQLLLYKVPESSHSVLWVANSKIQIGKKVGFYQSGCCN